MQRQQSSSFPPFRHKQARRIVLWQRQSLVPLKISMQTLERKVAELIADRLARIHARATQLHELAALSLRIDPPKLLGAN